MNPHPANVSDLSDPRQLASIIREQRVQMRQLEAETAATVRQLAARVRIVEAENRALKAQRDSALIVASWGGRVPNFRNLSR